METKLKAGELVRDLWVTSPIGFSITPGEIVTVVNGIYERYKGILCRTNKGKDWYIQPDKRDIEWELLGEFDGKICPIKGNLTKEDNVNKPKHYTFGNYEVIDVLMDWFPNEPLLWQVGKYISRAGKKDPSKELEDLKKAQYYLNKKIEILEKK